MGGTVDCPPPPKEVAGGDETIARAEVETLTDVAAGGVGIDTTDKTVVVAAEPERVAGADDPAGADEAGAEETIARAEVEALAKLDARLETAESGTTGTMLVLTLGAEDRDTTETTVVAAPVLGPT